MLVLALSCAEETNCRKLHKVGHRGLIVQKDSFILALFPISIRLTNIGEPWLLGGTFSAPIGGSWLGRTRADGASPVPTTASHTGFFHCCGSGITISKQVKFG